MILHHRPPAIQPTLSVVTGMAHQSHAGTLTDNDTDGTFSSIQERKKNNSLVPINQLPPEILGQVFLAWVLLWRRLRKEKLESRYGPMWTLILLVCRHWYDIAVSTPALWDTFAVSRLTRPCVAKELLRRCAQTPLNVTIYGTDMGNNVTHLVLDHITRIRTLIFRIDAWHRNSEYVLDHSAPLLQSLQYVDEGHFGANQIGVPFHTVDMPALASLEYRHDTYIPWDLPLLKPTLTRLSLNLAQDTTAYSDVGMDDVLQALVRMSLLEHLELHHVLPPESPDPLPSLPGTVSLPHLRTLDLLTRVSSAACFIQHVVYPPAAHVHISYVDGIRSSTAGSLYRALAARAPSLDADSPPLTVSIDESGLRVWSVDPGADVMSCRALAASVLDVPPPEQQHHPLLTITLDNWLHRVWYDVNGMLASCLDAGVLPVERVAVLYCRPSARTSGNSRNWAMSHVRALGIGHGDNEIAEESVREALSSLHPVATEEGQPEAVPLPALEVLLLRSVWLARSSAEQDGEGEVFRDLRQMLEARKAAGRQLQRLVLAQCVNLRATDLDVLGKLVREVEWGGNRHLKADNEWQRIVDLDEDPYNPLDALDDYDSNNDEDDNYYDEDAPDTDSYDDEE